MPGTPPAHDDAPGDWSRSRAARRARRRDESTGDGVEPGSGGPPGGHRGDPQPGIAERPPSSRAVRAVGRAAAPAPADLLGVVPSDQPEPQQGTEPPSRPGPVADTRSPGRVVPLARVRRLLSVAVAGFAALLTVGLVFGAQNVRESYAIVIFGVQILFVLAWTVATRPPAPRVVAVVGLAAAAAADVAAMYTRPASLASLTYVTAAAFVAGVVGQLLRPVGRIRVTESLGSTLAVVVGVVAFAMLIVLTRYPRGTQAIVACQVAAGVGVVLARLADTVLPYPRIAPQVPRGGFGVVLGAMGGTAAAAYVGSFLVGLTIERAAVAGLITVVVAVVVDLSVGYAEVSRHLAGEAPTLWLARHMQGPLGAFALAAPAAYAASALLIT